MKYLSVFTGIEAASVAWEPLGWQAIAFSEVSKHPCTVLNHHYPHVPNLGDVTRLVRDLRSNPTALGRVDLLVGGSPCQGFSNQGHRGGLGFVELLAILRPKWFIWENVKGVLTSHSGDDPNKKGEDFRAILGCFSGQLPDIPVGGWRNSGIIPGLPSAYSIAWRVLDGRHFSPNVRERVFVVGHLGDDGRPPAGVLFNREGDRGNPAAIDPSRPPRPVLSDRPLVAFKGKKHINAVHRDLAPTLTSMNHKDSWANSGRNIAIASDTTARWLTPIEYERCMGFPDNYTAMIPTGARFHAIGNSMNVHVMRWLGQQIENWELNNV